MQSDNADSPSRETAGTRLAAKRAAKAAKKAAARGTTNAVGEAANTVAHEATAWMDRHGRTVLIALGAGIAIAVGALIISNLNEGKNREAGALLQSAVTTAQGIVVPADETPPEDPMFPVFPSVKEREEKALGQFREVTKQFPDTLAGSYAQLGEANTQLRLGNYAEASTTFEKLRNGQAKQQDDFIRFRVLEGAGYALEGQKKYAEARERFDALSKLNNGTYRILGDYHRARMLVAEGKRDEAKKLLEELTKAEAEKPAETVGTGTDGQPPPAERYESALSAAQTLLTELGGKPPERSGGGSGISQQVLDSLRKQLGSQNANPEQ
jgi:tetratricopeptide (TPR) repeat protein